MSSSDVQAQQLLEELAETNRGVVALTAELEERTRALEEANRHKNEFLAMLAHELRNPLAVIRLVLDEVSPPQTQAVLRRQVDHVRRLVDDLLDVSRVERGKISLVRSTVDLVTVADHAVMDARRSAATKAQTVVWTRPPVALTVDADPARLTQMISNLLDNASKYSPDGTTITVRCRQESGAVVLEVTDEGRGLSESESESVFELFAQAGGPSSHSGLGIGLTLVRELAALHGGTVGASSVGRDRGSTFRLRLPHAPGSPEKDSASRAPAQTHARVLLIEDGDELRQLLAARLRRRGLTVHEAEDAEQALSMLPELVRDNLLDAVVSDLGLPGMSGYELGERVHDEFPALPLIALSGYGAEQDRQRTRDAGFTAHLVKPIELNELVKHIERTAR